MIEIIPAIDLIDGKCVRLSKGLYESKKVYNESPVEVAKAFEANGIQRLHLVDLDGARSQHIVNHKVLEAIASQTSLVIDFGGGLKTDDDLHIAFESGAKMITGGSIAVKDPDTFKGWIRKYGAERIILGADAKNKMIAVNGWKDGTTEELLPYLKKYIEQEQIQKVICTDIDCDGMLQGSNVALYQEILAQHPDLYLIASGGISNLRDIELLEEAGIPAVIFGKAIYEGKIKLEELQQFA
ncbi:MAG: 1-(5-phosphoribosyl)-5-[(5-phosphoribosylamino)methylideneamino]imidazole-4-carboxamide isomerase [Bacteroidaceae bacterium]|nr:1-(5-phosphoribosyl)-5-[(5-phosphoribosylamino)methylideneamino]imidazole-4-carboxamide isomerase [Bacteroidaceae bacterium]MBP9636860.1 1-(5-phosphoribosyl)-5-[(5-phosphoribosylamino)methylideneamino]imidazole-4-carboxamide isomerase [Bacteroidaceae bacterium]